MKHLPYSRRFTKSGKSERSVFITISRRWEGVGPGQDPRTVELGQKLSETELVFPAALEGRSWRYHALVDVRSRWAQVSVGRCTRCNGVFDYMYQAGA